MQLCQAAWPFVSVVTTEDLGLGGLRPPLPPLCYNLVRSNTLCGPEQEGVLAKVYSRFSQCGECFGQTLWPGFLIHSSSFIFSFSRLPSLYFYIVYLMTVLYFTERKNSTREGYLFVLFSMVVALKAVCTSLALFPLTCRVCGPFSWCWDKLSDWLTNCS